MFLPRSGAFLGAFWAFRGSKTPHLSTNPSPGPSKTLHLSTNPLESAAPDSLGAPISSSGATGCSNCTFWSLQGASWEPPGSLLGVSSSLISLP